MTMIVPAGNKNVNWSPKDETLVKTAATSVSQDIDDSNPLYLAAKKFIEAQAEAEKSEKDENKSDVIPAKDSPAPAKDPKLALPAEGSPVIEVGEPATTEEKVEEAVGKIEEAVVEIKDATGVTTEEAEIEIEVEDVGAPSIPGKEDSTNDIVVKSEPQSPCACAETKKEVKEAKKKDKKEDVCKECKKTPCICKKEEAKSEVKMDKSAVAEEEFCKFAKLSPVNKTKLAKYWTDMLGFPKEYVNLMTKDYEK